MKLSYDIMNRTEGMEKHIFVLNLLQEVSFIIKIVVPWKPSKMHMKLQIRRW